MNDNFEQLAWAEGKLLLSVDECGIGNFAGGGEVGYVIFPANYNFAAKLSGVRDSKKLSKAARETIEPTIKAEALYWAVDEITIPHIEARSAYHARFDLIRARVDECERLRKLNYKILLDGNARVSGLEIENDCLIKGDNICYSIAAASILAKCEKDRKMKILSAEFPEYDWETNSGYGTPKHIEAIRKFGLTKYHRRSYCKKYIEG